MSRIETDRLKAILCRELHLDIPNLGDAVAWALERLEERGYDPLTVAPAEFGGEIADGIEDFLGCAGYPLHRELNAAAFKGWREQVRVAFGKAQRLVS